MLPTGLWSSPTRAADPPEVDHVYARTQCPICGLPGATLSIFDASGADLTFANMANAAGCGALPELAKPTGANLSDAIVIGADLAGADLGLADLTTAVTDVVTITSQQTACRSCVTSGSISRSWTLGTRYATTHNERR